MKATAFTSVVASIFCVFLATVALAGVNTWTTSGPVRGGVTAVAVDPGESNIVYAAASTGLPSTSGVFTSVDGGMSWGSGTLTDQIIGALAVGPSGTVYVGTNSGAVFRSADGGRTWTAIAAPNPSRGTTLIKTDTNSPQILYRATAERVAPGGNALGELLRSTDGGASWTRIDSGLGLLSVRALALDPQNSGTLFAVTNAGFFKSTSFGATWSPIANGLVSRIVISLAVDPSTPMTLYATTFLSGVLRSTDGGITFNAANAGLSNTGVGVLIPDPAHPSKLYLGTNGSGVFVSLDGGGSWTALNSGLTDLVIGPLAIDSTGTFLHTGTRGSGVFDFQIEPSGGGSCSAGPTALCLNSDRFRVEVSWQVPSQGTSGVGQALALTSDTGAFWLFDSANIELVVKVLDGRRVNGKFWVFSGALSNVEYTVTVTDTQTGAVKTYFNPQGRMASVADTSAF